MIETYQLGNTKLNKCHRYKNNKLLNSKCIRETKMLCKNITSINSQTADCIFVIIVTLTVLTRFHCHPFACLHLNVRDFQCFSFYLCTVIRLPWIADSADSHSNLF